MAKETTYEFSFIFDGDDSLENVLRNLIIDCILRKKDEKSLFNSDKQPYNSNTVPVLSVSGSCKNSA